MNIKVYILVTPLVPMSKWIKFKVSNEEYKFLSDVKSMKKGDWKDFTMELAITYCNKWKPKILALNIKEVKEK
jgi:hypothetical protein